MRLIVVAVRRLLLSLLLTVIIMTSSSMTMILLLPLPMMTTAAKNSESYLPSLEEQRDDNINSNDSDSDSESAAISNSKTTETETQIETETIRHTTSKSNSLPHPLLPPPTIQRQLQLRPSTYTGKILRKMTRLIRRFSSIDITHSSIYDHYYEEYYNPKLAFEMAILSNLSYLDFHKDELPIQQQRRPSTTAITGFSLLEGNDDYHNSDLLLSMIHKLSSMIQNSHPITLSLSLSSHSKSYSNRKINKEDGKEEEKKRNNDSSKNNTNTNNNNNPYYNFEYFFYNWYEPTGVKGVNFHDTDVLISTTTATTTTTTTSSRSKKKSSDLDSDSDYYYSTTTTKSPNTLIITFAGTSSYADAFTNIQTFEPANHSRFFEPSPSSSPRPSSRPSPHPSDDDVDEDVRNKWKRRKRRYNTNTNTNTNTNSSSSSSSLIQGSLHRGFLNAYSRVERGSVLRLSSLKSKYSNNNNASSSYNTRKERKKKKKKRRLSSLPHILDGLHKRFGRCTADYIDDDNDNDDDDNDNDETTMDSNTIPPLDKKRQRHKKKGGSGRGGGCRFTKKGEEIRLSIVLKELVNNALKNGYTVHVTGHSLGGALATLLVLDVLVNKNNDDNDNDNGNGNGNGNGNNNNNPIDIPTSNLHLWTYGAPQVADSLFLESVTNNSKKLRNFLGIIGMDKRRSNRRRRRRQRQRKHHNHKKQFHRFVTLSDDGKVDVVSEVAKTALAAHKELEYLQEEDIQGTTTTTTTKGATNTDTKPDTDNTDDGTTQNNKNNNVAATTTTNNSKKKKKRSTKKSSRSKRRKWLRTNLLHGKVARSLGGVSRGGHYVTHFIEPHYLWTPDQYQRHHHYYNDMEHYNTTTTSTTSNTSNNSTSTTTSNSSSSNTRSSVAAHSMSNYLIGISREACSSSSTRRSTANDKCNPLIPDVPPKWLEYLDINSYYVEVLSSTVQ